MPHSQSIPSHVIENVEFFCGPTSQVALGQFRSSSIVVVTILPLQMPFHASLDHYSNLVIALLLYWVLCLPLLMRRSVNGTEQSKECFPQKCASLVSLFDCSRDKMDAECGEGTLITLAASINAFGCTIKGMEFSIYSLIEFILNSFQVSMRKWLNCCEYPIRLGN